MEKTLKEIAELILDMVDEYKGLDNTVTRRDYIAWKLRQARTDLTQAIKTLEAKPANVEDATP